MENKKNIFWPIMILSLFVLSYIAVTPIVSNIYASYPDVSLDNIQLVVTLIPLFSVITMFSCNSLCLHFSMKNVSIMGMILIIMGAILPIVNESIFFLYLSSILIGLGIGVVNVVSSTMISFYFKGKSKVKVMGYQSLFMCLGGALFSLLSGFISSYNWRFSYLSFLIGIIAIIMLLKLPNDKLEKNKKNSKCKLSKRVYILGFITFLFYVAANVFNTSISLLIDSLGFSSNISGLVTTCYMLIGIIAGLSLNKIVKYFKNQTLSFTCLMAATSFMMIGMSTDILPIFVGTLFLGFAYATRNPAGMTFVSNMTDVSKSALALAIFNGCAHLGAFASPYIINLISNLYGGSISTIFVIAGILMFIISILHISLNPVKEKDII